MRLSCIRHQDAQALLIIVCALAAVRPARAGSATTVTVALTAVQRLKCRSR
jgi:hypothetical protein